MKWCRLVLVAVVLSTFLTTQSGCQQKVKAKAEPIVQRPTTKQDVVKTEVEGPAPKIIFTKSVLDLGDVAPGSKSKGEFTFTNTGKGVLKVKKKIKSTCGCTVPTLEKEEYLPGESGTIKVQYKAGKHAGMSKKYLHVYSNDKTKSDFKLTVQANVVVQVEYEPKILKLSFKEEDLVGSKITLTSLDNQPFSIRSFSSTGNSITADFNTAKNATKFVLSPKINAERLGKNLNGKIHISLSHPKCRSVSIPFRTLPRFSVTPPVLNIRMAKPQVPVKRKLWVSSNYEEEFDIASVTSKKGMVKLLSQEKIGKRYQIELEVTPPAADDKTRMFSDTCIINLKNGSKLEVNCFGLFSSKKNR